MKDGTAPASAQHDHGHPAHAPTPTQPDVKGDLMGIVRARTLSSVSVIGNALRLRTVKVE